MDLKALCFMKLEDSTVCYHLYILEDLKKRNFIRDGKYKNTVEGNS